MSGLNQEPKKPRKPSQITGRKRKGRASKNQPGGVTGAGRLRFTRARYYYCPRPTSHLQVPSKLPGDLPGLGTLGLLSTAHSAGRRYGSQLLFILAACGRAETRRRSRDSDDARPPRSARRPPASAPGSGRKQSAAASQSAGGTLRLRHRRRAPSQSRRHACASVASAPPPPGGAPSDRGGRNR